MKLTMIFRALRSGARVSPLLAGLSFLLACQTSHAQTNALGIPASEFNALAAFYASTGGPSWTSSTGWTNARAASWYGLTITGGHVTTLALDYNQLSGSIPTNLGSLSQLQQLILVGNPLSGSIPANLGSLSQLQVLVLGDQLSGTIPANLGSLSQLQRLDLDGNQLSGSIPTNLGNLSQLQDLYLDGNQLSGNIPTNLGSLSQLQVLFLSNNQLSGNIPANLGNLSQLQSLYLDGNQLSGSIPTSIGNLSNMLYLFLDNNELSGVVPYMPGAEGDQITLQENFLDIATGSQSLSNIQAMANAGYYVYYTPQYSYPSVLTAAATAIGANGATLNGTVNPEGPAATVYFAYGTTTNYGTTNVLTNALNGTDTVSVSDSIAGLVGGTLYHFQVFASNSVVTSGGGDEMFITVPLLLTTNVMPAGAGLMVVNPPSSNGLYVGGTQIEITATPVGTNVFMGWTGGTLSGDANPATLTLSNSATINAIFGPAPVNGCASVPSNLVAWWKAEGNALDVTGNYNGTLGGDVSFAPGEVGLGFCFDGSQIPYVALPSAVFPFPGSTPFTFETWFETTNGGVILGQQGGAPYSASLEGGYVPAIYVDTNGLLRTDLFWSGAVQQTVSPATVNDGYFHHVAVTYDGTNEVTYLDGVTIGNQAMKQKTYASVYQYQLGTGYTDPGGGWPATPAGAWYTFNGVIDEAAVFSRALQAAEIGAIAVAGTNGMCEGSLAIVTTNGLFGFTHGQFHFTVTGAAGSTAVVQASSNLRTWMPLATNTFSGGSFTFTDLLATNLNRFYRAVLPP